MQLHKEMVILEDPGNKCTAPEAEMSSRSSHGPVHMLGGEGEGEGAGAKGCYRSRALKAIVKSVVFILRKKGSHLLF